MAYVKNLVAGSLLDSALPDDPDLRVELEAYVPEPLRPTVAHLLDQHPLRRELIATELTNRLVDRAGLTVIMRLVEETAASVPEVVTAIATAWRLLELDQRWDRIRAVIGEVPIGVAIEMLQATKALGERASRWLIRNRHAPLDISATLAELGPPVRRIVASIEQVATPSSTQALDEHRDRWVAAGVPADLATEVAHGPLASMAFDIVGAARAEGAELELAARVFFLIDDRLGLGWLRQQIDDLPRDDQWSTLARTALRDDLFHEHAALVRRILASGRADDAHELCDRWVRANHAQIDRAFDVLVDIRSIGTPGLEHLSVALREIRNLMRRAGGVTPTATDE